MSPKHLADHADHAATKRRFRIIGPSLKDAVDHLESEGWIIKRIKPAGPRKWVVWAVKDDLESWGEDCPAEIAWGIRECDNCNTFPSSAMLWPFGGHG